MVKKTFLCALAAVAALGGEAYYINGGKRVWLTPLPETSTRSLSESKETACYLDEAGRKLCIPARVVAKFKEGADVKGILEAYGLIVLKKYSFGSMYLLKAASPQAALEAANALAENPDVDFAQPDVMRKRSLR